MDTNSVEIQTEEQVKGILSFVIDEEVYGIDIAKISDIMALSQVSEIPMVADYIEGVINLRGKVIPIVNLRVRFGKEKANTRKSCIVIVMVEDYLVGIIVDRVCDVIKYTSKSVSESAMGINKSRFISNIFKIEGNIYQILDVKRIASDKGDEEKNEDIG